MVARSQSSASGVLALLSEPDPIFKQHALKALVPLVPQFWAEISEHIAHMFVTAFFLFSSLVAHPLAVRHCTKATTSQRQPATRPHSWPAKSTTFSASMTKRCHSPSALEARSRQRLGTTEQRSTSRLSFVSIFAFYHFLLPCTNTVPAA